MKIVLTISWVLFSIFSLNAQTWQPILSDDTCYYSVQVPVGSSDSFLNGYVTSIRVAQFTNLGSTKIFQFPFSMRKNEHDVMDPLTGNSWLGYQCVWDTLSGECILKNQYLDSIVILTYAMLNDSWIASRDTNGIDYHVTVSSIIPITIDGQSDSVKVMTIQAFTGNTPVNNYYNGFEIQLSKDHGFYVLPDIYAFPNYDSIAAWVTGIPYLKIQREHKRIDRAKTFINAASVDFSVKFQPGNEWINHTTEEHFIPITGNFHDSVLSWTPLSSTQAIVQFHKHHLWDSLTNIPPLYYSQVLWSGNTMDSVFQDTINHVALRTLSIEPILSNYNPSLQPSNSFLWYFFSEPCTGLVEIGDSLCYETPLSGSSHNSDRFLQYFGRIAFHRQSDGGTQSYNYDERMAYVKMGSCVMGSPFWFAPNTRNEIKTNDIPFNIYPNPCYNELSLSVSKEISSYGIKIKNVQGLTLLAYGSPIKVIDLSHLPQGVYSLELISHYGRWVQFITKW